MNKRSTRFDLQRLLTAKSPGAQALWGLSFLLLLLGVASCLSSRPQILIYPTANPVLGTALTPVSTVAPRVSVIVTAGPAGTSSAPLQIPPGAAPA